MGEPSLPACLQKACGRLVEPVQKEAGSSTSTGFESKKAFGLVYFSIIPVDDNETVVIDGTPMEEAFTVYVHNYTGFFRKPVEGRIHQGRNPVPVKVWRIIDNATGDWMEQEYVIVLVTKNYFGASLVKVKPDKPVMNIEVKIRVNKKAAFLNHAIEKPTLTLPLLENLSHPSIEDSVVKEEVNRIRTYLAMLDSERNCGLISEKAYRRLKRRLESVLFEIIFGEEAVSSREKTKETVPQYPVQWVKQYFR